MSGALHSVAALLVDGVSFRYRADRPLLRDITIACVAGTTTAILGPNGVGKTTLLNLCLGWLRPEAGRVLLFDRDISRISRGEMGRTISLVPQNEHVAFEYSLLEWVLLGRAPHLGPLEVPNRQHIAVAMQSLERVGLAARAAEPVMDFSAGEQQLAMFARALTQEARVLLLDEPSAHLDLSNKRRMTELLHAHTAAGGCALITTHELEFAAACATQVVLIGREGIVAAGPTAQALTSAHVSRAFGAAVRVEEVSGRLTALW